MYGLTSSKAARGPDTIRLAVPAATTWALPLTGAHSSTHPRLLAAAATRSDASTETVEWSTMMRGALPADDSRPPGPIVTSSKSAELPTTVKTMSRSARSAILSTIAAPRDFSGSAFERVLFHTATSLPAAASRDAMAKPMRPAPSQPSRNRDFRPFSATFSSSHSTLGERSRTSPDELARQCSLATVRRHGAQRYQSKLFLLPLRT